MPVEALAALADPIRRELVDLLAGGELAAGELADRFPVSRPAISRHLRVLREAGLVRVAHRGQARPLRARPAARCGSSTTGWSPTATCGRSGWTHWTPRSPADGGHGRNGDAHERARDREDRRGIVTARTTAGSGWSSAGPGRIPIEDVWSALTEPDRLARWIGGYEGERGAGGTGRSP